MNHEQIARAISALSLAGIGMKEAAVLMAIGDGATASEIAARANQKQSITHVRLGTLRSKGLCKIDGKVAGIALHRLTKEGTKIVTQALP